MSEQFKKGFIDAGGIRTHYLEAGSGDPIILIHGGGSGADSWGNWKDCLPLFAPNFRAIAMDMVGFGETDKPDPAGYTYSQENRNKHLLAFIDAMGIRPKAVIGNSMGGATALGAMIRRPGAAEKLVLMGAAGVKTEEPRTAAFSAIVNYDFTIEGMRRLIAALASPRYKPSDEMVAYRHRLSVDPPTRAALKAINEITKQGGLIYPDDEIRGVTAPTLVVNGKLDQVSTITRALRFLELIPNSWGYILPHCGHWVMIEAPEDFCSAVTTFLKKPE